MLLNCWEYFIESLKDAKTIISIVSAVLSATSLFFTRRFWLAANRPIISACIVSDNDKSGNVSTFYNLVVYNTGNRPATFIRIHAEKEMIDKILDVSRNVKELEVNDIYRCFSNETTIPLLINGKEIFNSFGLTSRYPEKNVLKYNSQLPILISYSDLENRNYTSRQVLIVKNSQGFAGSVWLEPS